MDRVRALLTTILLAGFALAGSLALTFTGVVGVVAGDSSGLVGTLVSVAVVAALPWLLGAVAPAVVALFLLPRHPRAGSVVATLYGLLVVALSARHVHEDSLVMLAHVAGLALVACAFPLGEPADESTPGLGGHR